jgi:hypothetical protein
VKVWAEARGIPVFQPVKLRDGVLAAALRPLSPDVAVVAAYGRILPAELLTLPRLGCLNVHGSFLQNWRGAAPIQWAVAATRRQASLMQMGGARHRRHAVVAADRPRDTGGSLRRVMAPTRSGRSPAYFGRLPA